jgi:hypothetical protein
MLEPLSRICRSFKEANGIEDAEIAMKHSRELREESPAPDLAMIFAKN